MNFFSLNCQLPPHVYRLLGAFVVERSDMALAIPPLMAILSTVVQGKFAVLHPSGHATELSMYWMGIADSSACKGGVFSNVRSPLESVIGRRVEKDKQKLANAEIMNRNIDAELKTLRRKLHKLEGDEREAVVNKIASLEADKNKQQDVFVFDTQDITDAGLIKLLSGQEGNRVGILDAEGRFTRCILESTFLHTVLNQTYDGEPMSNCRAGKFSVYNLKAHVSIGIMAQPAKLEKLANKPRLWDEGFLPRVMPVFAYSLAGYRPTVGTTSDTEILTWYKQRMEYLFDYPWMRDGEGKLHPYVITVSEDAFSLWNQYAAWLEGQMHPNCEHRLIAAWLGKAATATLRIAALYHLLESPSPVQESISAHNMQFAIDLNKALIPNVEKIFDKVHPSPLFSLITRMLRWLYSRLGTNPYFTLREFYRATGTKEKDAFPAVRWLIDNHVIYVAHDPKLEALPGFPHIGRPKSIGYAIDFNVLSRIDISSVGSNFHDPNFKTCVQGLF